jgi:hypothetical protein
MSFIVRNDSINDGSSTNIGSNINQVVPNTDRTGDVGF